MTDDFKEKVEEYVNNIDNEEWTKDVILFASKQLYDVGYDAVVTIDTDSFWDSHVVVINRETDESEKWETMETWLDIFAVDRKADPMVFDERVEDLEFASQKCVEILECKINLIAGALEGMSAGEVYDAHSDKFDKVVTRRNSYESDVR
jgi:hypothetical protein